MIRLLAIAATAATVLGATAASAQVYVPTDPGYGTPYGYSSDNGYVPYGRYGYQGRGYGDQSYSYGGALSGQCSTDEGYGRRASCDTGGGN